MRYTPIRYTPTRCMLMRHTPVRCPPMRYTPCEMHAHEMHARKAGRFPGHPFRDQDLTVACRRLGGQAGQKAN
jgi:hypothetical protein